MKKSGLAQNQPSGCKQMVRRTFCQVNLADFFHLVESRD